MKASRLLSVLLLLQSRGRMSAQQLADELEVSVRTIYRDVEALSASGVPVYADRGAAGGYQLLDGYRTKLTGLHAGEAESLLFAGMPEAAAELGLGELLAAAQLKLSVALAPELRERAAATRERFLLDAPGWFREADQTPFLTDIAGAVWRQVRVRVRYRRWGQQVVDRDLEPLGLVLKAGTWYLVATVDGGAPRSYRVSRVLSAAVLDEPFHRRESFELAKFWAGRQEELAARMWSGSATVRLSPRGRELLFLLGGQVKRAAEDSFGEPSEDGWVRAVLPIESTEHAVHALLQLAGEVEVLQPVELRARIAEETAVLAGMYGLR